VQRTEREIEILQQDEMILAEAEVSLKVGDETDSEASRPAAVAD